MTRDELPERLGRLDPTAEPGVLTALLVHELRQPLFALRATLQLALADDQALQGDELRALLKQLDHIEHLATSYAGFGRTDEAAERIDLCAPAGRAVEMLEHRRDRLGVQTHLEVDHEVWVRARPTALTQIVLNLVQNAYDAASELPQSTVWVRVLREHQLAVVEVEDNGGGVPETVRGRVFDAFVSSKGPERGTGLGLYVAWRLAHEAGGDSTLSPRPDGGTVVRLVLPWCDAP